MIFWSSQKLEAALAKGEVGEWEKVKYLLVPAVAGYLTAGPMYIVKPVYGEKLPLSDSLFSFVFSIFAACLVYWGIKSCYQANQQIDGKLFFERLTVLSFPVTVRLLVVFLVLSFSLMIFASIQKDSFPQLYEMCPLILSALNPVVAYLMYMMITESFKRLGVLLLEKEN